MRHFLILGFAVLAASCATADVVAPTEPAASASAPAGPLDLGDWQHATAAIELSTFEQTIAGRYAAGLAISAATTDLQHNQFTCAPNHDTSNRGEPPAQICRKTVTQAGCTHTWQVHLFDTHGDAHIARSRGLYDRRCGNEGLLGGPS